MFVLNSFVPLVTNGGWNFFKGHNPNYLPHYDESVIPKKIDLEELDLQRYYYRAGFEYLAEEPKRALKNAFRKIISLYEFDRQPWPMDRGRAFDVPYPTLKWGPFILFFALVGLAGFRKFPALRCVLISLIILQTALCAIFFGNVRFRAPLEPLLFMSACFGLFFLINFILMLCRRFRIYQK
jgi:hypothetical protein